MSEDAELLRQYAQSGSETAFAELVGRHLPLVYATALRQGCSDGALAKDVAQTVFIDLARKASSLLGRELLAGWLYTSTRLAASKAVRGDRRRQVREQIAASMQEQTTPPDSQSDQAELRLVLDEAMSELDAGERNAVLIKFFQGKELKEVGSALGISEDAARMRITRALDRLHGLLSQRGLTLSVAALGTALATEAATTAPAGLAGTIAGIALASAASASGGVSAYALGGLRQFLWSRRRSILGFGSLAVTILVVVRLMTQASVPARAPQPTTPEVDSSPTALLAESTPTRKRMGTSLTATSGIKPTLQIEGTFSMIDRSGKETPWTDFRVWVSGEKYRVSNRYFNGELLINGSDGTNSHFVNTMANATPNQWEWGRVSAGQFPAKDLAAGQLCWLAFASASYFATNTPVTVPLESFQENAEFLRCDVTFLADQWHLPRLLKWYGSDDWHFSGGNRMRLGYANGFLAGVYLVTSTTNYQSIELPITFELKTFLPSFSGKDLASEEITLVQTLQGRVYSITSSENIDDFRPELGPRAQILDFRFPAGTNGGLRGNTRLNGTWPEPSAAGQR